VTEQTYQPRHAATPAATAAHPEPGTGPGPADKAAWTTEPPQDPAASQDPGSQPTTGGQSRKEPGRTRASSLDRMSREGLTEAAEHAFRGAGTALNGLCAEDDDDDVWIPTDDETEGVADPTGRLLARRLPEVPGGDASDAADLVALAIPLGIWLIRGLAQWLPRLRRRKVIPGQVVAPETEETR